jgi:nitrite reductase/ring-hydroxylating ferredoxin subunit
MNVMREKSIVGNIAEHAFIKQLGRTIRLLKILRSRPIFSLTIPAVGPAAPPFVVARTSADGDQWPVFEKPPFANPDVVVESWYVVARSRDLAREQVLSTDTLGRRVAVYRDASGRLHAMDGRCAHLGADLGQGRVDGDQLECGLHHWRYASNGSCASAPPVEPARHLRVYPVLERWGLVWVYAGARPAFDMPALPATGGPAWRLSIPPQYIKCHPHLIIGNGLDPSHLGPLHGLQAIARPRLERSGAHELTVHLKLRPVSRLFRFLVGKRDVAATFTTIGATIALISVLEPMRFSVLFAATPWRDGSRMRALLFTPRSVPLAARALLLTVLVTADDRPLLERMQFRPAFTESDEGLRAFAEIVNSMTVFR